MLNAGVTLCLLMAYHTVIVGPSLNLLGYELNKLEYEWRRSDKQIRQFYNTMGQTQNKINEDAFNRQKALKKLIEEMPNRLNGLKAIIDAYHEDMFNRLKELKEAIGVAPSKTNASQEQ